MPVRLILSDAQVMVVQSFFSHRSLTRWTMLGSAAIDLMIGLVTLYLLLATMCSAGTEWILRRLQSRGRLLREALEALFAVPSKKDVEEERKKRLEKDPKVGLEQDAKDEPKPVQTQILDDVYKHGMVGARRGTTRVSYISARAFAAAIVDELIPGPDSWSPEEEAGEQKSHGAKQEGMKASAEPRADEEKPKARVLRVSTLRASLEKWPDSPAKEALLAILDRAGGNLDEVREQIEVWYADCMDRVTGIYKRHVQLCLFITGLVLAAILNADTIMVARVLASDPQTRATVVAKALEIVRDPASAGVVPAASLRGEGEESSTTLGRLSGKEFEEATDADVKDDLETPKEVSQPSAPRDVPRQGDYIGLPRLTPEEFAKATEADRLDEDGGEVMTPSSSKRAAASHGSVAAPDPVNQTSIEDLEARMRAAQRALLGSGLPLGWSTAPEDPRAYPWAAPGAGADVAGRCFLKLLGLLMTAAAVSFGAPFWFDLLCRVSNLRSAGPKPPRPDAVPGEKPRV